MRDVFAATYERNTSGALMWAYCWRQWCSTDHTRSKPISSARTACSTHSLITCRSFWRVGSASWASKIIENCTSAPEGSSQPGEDFGLRALGAVEDAGEREEAVEHAVVAADRRGHARLGEPPAVRLALVT